MFDIVLDYGTTPAAAAVAHPRPYDSLTCDCVRGSSHPEDHAPAGLQLPTKFLVLQASAILALCRLKIIEEDNSGGGNGVLCVVECVCWPAAGKGGNNATHCFQLMRK
ncbi:hypothetical protein PVAP13_1NG149000 [Panicum virgatum]|uniref:Uncharacterized protein n=1 Tax=Panicum virgatum TaxID=38727 RepID=A0A8T0WSL6_PANVG|nr:hypothetical protein PVAP13_1NG149000 [Panicum virgatum]KAG2649959.1 hypothetical protein PVAP13_1NG149000 [Panicum virgatum]